MVGSEAQTEGGLSAVIAALRYSGDEIQTTRAVHAFAAADANFAAGLMTLILDVARRTSGEPGRRARALPEPVGDVVCERERPTGSRESEVGRCDLWFTAGEPASLTLAVELKHYARYTLRQREKYLAELARRVSSPSGLVVITGRAHPAAPRAVLRNRRWIGELSWESLYEAGLGDLAFRDQHLGAGWSAFVNALRAGGDFGTITTMDLERFALWAARDPSVSWSNAEKLLAGVVSGAQAELDRKLDSVGLSSRLLPANKSGSPVYVRGRGYVSISFALSARGSEELQLVLTPSADQDDARARLQVWFLPRSSQTWLAGSGAERRVGFRFDADHRGWYRETRLLGAESAPELRQQVLKDWKAACRGLERLRAFEGLGAAGVRAAPSDSEPPAERLVQSQA